MPRAVLFIGNYTDNATYQIITSNNIRDLSQASRMFQKRFIDCLANEDIDFYPISIVPTNGAICLPSKYTERKTAVSVIPVKNGSIRSAFAAMRMVREILCGIDADSISVVMYAVNPIGLLPLLNMKRKQKLILTTICPELPQFRRYKKNIYSLIKRYIFNIFNKCFDRYIVFADAMKQYLPSGKRYMLLEGFAPDEIQKAAKREKNIAMYAGGLAADNGIKMMIEAAEQSNLLDELWICGVGPTLDYVISHVDEKVKYLGRLDNEQVIECEKKAKVLLNVRDPRNELTRFSFPSKILEYMASGGIVISSMLQGIPKEYDKYLILLEDYSAKQLAIKMDEVFSLTQEDFIQNTRSAIEFCKTKCAYRRANEIVNFITF